MLKVLEIYESIQGELPNIGRPCTVVRLAGCNLHCPYCDAPNDVGTEMTTDEVLHQVAAFQHNEILLTGGEPLLQMVNVLEFVHACHELDLRTVVETNGTVSLKNFMDLDQIVMDIKLFGDDEMLDFAASNLKYLHEGDVIKFVYQNKYELERAIEFVRCRYMNIECMVVFSPVDLNQPHADLIIDLARTCSSIDVRLQVQVHKILNLG